MHEDKNDLSSSKEITVYKAPCKENMQGHTKLPFTECIENSSETKIRTSINAVCGVENRRQERKETAPSYNTDMQIPA